LDVIEKINSTGQLQPYLTFGKWGTGFLTQLSNTEYRFVIDSDYLHSMYAQGLFGDLELTVKYDGVSTLVIEISEFVPGLVFEKDQYVENLPVRPWGANTCGPIELKV